MPVQIQKNADLSKYTSFRTGGKAENLVYVSSTDELIEILRDKTYEKVWLLGYGSNTLLTDGVLPGLTVVMKGGSINRTDTEIIADAGVWWDDVVLHAIHANLWGIELLSEIPGSLGAALYINITAYGQSIGRVVNWIDAWDTEKNTIIRLEKSDLSWAYKHSIFQEDRAKSFIILRACLQLSYEMTDQLSYQKALDVAEELELDPSSLTNRRKIILEARERAGSIWRPEDSAHKRTAGSFFRNPLVSREQLEKVIRFDESGKTKKEIEKMNTVHGGDIQRVSAAHVMLAAGFKRGQTWGNVKLNDKNLLKIEALSGATSQEIYNVMKLIQETCYAKLAIQLEPEARIIGDFG